MSGSEGLLFGLPFLDDIFVLVFFSASERNRKLLEFERDTAFQFRFRWRRFLGFCIGERKRTVQRNARNYSEAESNNAEHKCPDSERVFFHRNAAFGWVRIRLTRVGQALA